MKLIETHCHTRESSSCGQVPAERVVQIYMQAGYDGLVITDHFSRYNSERFPIGSGQELSFQEQVTRLFKGYNIAKKVAGEQISVLPGMEIRFDSDANDYLVYGMTEEQLGAHPNIFEWGIKKFSEYSRNHNLLLVQAHPFRNNMRIVNPELIDMIEVYNGNPRQESRNEIARHMAELNNLPGSAGSDFHREGDEAVGGVLLPRAPENIQDFIVMMRENPLLVTK